MSEICSTCGLPTELCVCEDLAKETQSGISIIVEKRRYGKFVTLISGIQQDSVGGDLNELASKLKTYCACGGTIKNGVIELQGDQKKKATAKLRSLDFNIG